MILTKKIRLKPSSAQTNALFQSAGTARWAYNWTLGKQKDNYENGGKFLSDNIVRKELTQLKKTDEFSWLTNVSNNVAKQAVKDACNAYKRFFTKQSGFPRFKKKHRTAPSFYNDNVKLKSKPNKTILLEKIGWVKTNEQLPCGVKYINPRIKFDGKYWYLTVGIESEDVDSKLSNEVLGIDVGIKELAVVSDGRVYKNINKTKEVKRLNKRLRRLQRQVSRKYEKNREGNRYVKTSNILKVEHQIKLVHRRLTNIRNNHLHQTTADIVKTKPCKVVVEDLNVSNMMKNRHLAKAIAHQKLNEFNRQLEYKCQKFGIEFVKADRWFPSSKMCSQCKTIKKDLKLSDRTYHCECGNHLDRDLNASLNLANYSVELINSH